MMQLGTKGRRAANKGRRTANTARRLAMAIAFVVIAAFGGVFAAGGVARAQQAPVLPAQSQEGQIVATPPGNNLSNTLGAASDSDIWREIRRGRRGSISFADTATGVLIQSEGQTWRAIRNGPLRDLGWWGLAGVVALLALFFAARGRIRITAGPSGRKVERFTTFERFVHWMTAGSFVVLALTGLNILYGRYLFASGLEIGNGEFTALHQAFAALTHYGKIAHNAIGFSFIIGIVLMFVIWVRDNLPDRYDAGWIAAAGGLFSQGAHPPSGKFNFGQKMVFWSVMAFGVVLFGTGISLMFPFFWFGMQDMQLVNLIHSAVALVAIAIILAHIYIGTIGMEGAFDAMGTGQVDENWARENHSAWLAEIEGAPPPDDASGGGASQPAE